MKMLPLTKLVRRSKAVKKLTASGQTITEQSTAARDEWLDAELGRMLKELKTGVSTSRLILESRR